MNHFSTFTMLHIFCQIGIRKLLCCKYINVNIQFEYYSHTLCEQKSFLDYIFCAAAAERVQLITEEQIQWQSAESKGKKNSRETNKKKSLDKHWCFDSLIFPLQFYCSAAAIVSFKCVLYIYFFCFVHSYYLHAFAIDSRLVFFSVFGFVLRYSIRLTRTCFALQNRLVLYLSFAHQNLFSYEQLLLSYFFCFLLLFWCSQVTVFLFIAKNISNRKSAQSLLQLIGSCDLS